jgi:hypothetical protein
VVEDLKPMEDPGNDLRRLAESLFAHRLARMQVPLSAESGTRIRQMASEANIAIQAAKVFASVWLDGAPEG